ncbi:MAG: hypothetical protein HOQ19_15010 [Gemmatimonadaceae bacterium]|nr:hypothetical protein [Gemmatimonadaceae bacterium]
MIDTLERRRESDAELLPETPGEVVNVLAAPPIPAPASPRSPAPPPRPSTGRNEAPLVIITRTS